MDWDFSEDPAFVSLCDSFRESNESSVIEFLANGEGSFYFQELIQNAAGEGIDLDDTELMNELNQEIIEAIENL
tara:strand:- start:8954 stop:9175 length:222 start_codon:yes stop_codon:yes gene_type:complete